MDDIEIQHAQALAEQQSLLIDSVPIQVWFFTNSHTYGRVNKSYLDFLGKSKKEVEFQNLENILPPKVANECKQSNRSVFESKETICSESWIPDSKGHRRLIKMIKEPRFDKNGNILSIMCFGIDITENKKTEIILSQNEKNFRTFIETIDDIVVVGKPEGQIIYSNPTATAKLGYSFDEFRAMRILDMHPEFVRKEAVTILSEMFNGKRDTCPLPLIHKNGTIVPVETRAWAGTWNGADCIFGISKDLSKEQEALQKFDRLFKMNPALMVVSRIPDRVLVNVNDAFLKVLGFSVDEVIGKTSAELGLFVDDEEQKRVAHMLSEYGSIRDLDFRIKTKAGDIRDGLFSGELIESQGVKYFLTVMIDITERKQAEAERQKTIQELSNAIAEIKTLRGIVPICASCKRIRDDKGFWDQVETYVAKHTEAQFSHAICPDCMKELYPSLCKDKGGTPNK